MTSTDTWKAVILESTDTATLVKNWYFWYKMLYTLFLFHISFVASSVFHCCSQCFVVVRDVPLFFTMFHCCSGCFMVVVKTCNLSGYVLNFFLFHFLAFLKDQCVNLWTTLRKFWNFSYFTSAVLLLHATVIGAR